MIYTYHCQYCKHNFELNLSIANRNEPLKERCPSCESQGTVTRSFETGGVLYDGIKSVHTRAREKMGSDWNEVLKRVHKGAGQHSQIQHD